MAAIEAGTLNFQQVYTGDMFHLEFDISGIDITGKLLEMQWREDSESDPVVTFQESDNSLTKIVYSTILTSVTLHKDASEMNIPVLSERSPDNRYYLTVVMFTNADDIETIVKGYAEVVPQYTFPL